MTDKLTKTDVSALLADPNAENKATAAAKIAAQYASAEFSGDESRLAADIFRLMLGDVEAQVRKSLSSGLAGAAALPKDIARTIASDTDEDIAVPFIKTSQALSAADLIDIIRVGDEAKQIAVASRDSVDEEVSDVLIKEGKENAVVRLVSNEGAAIKQESFTAVLDRFGEDNAKFHAPLIMRKQIPMAVAERLVHKVSQDLQKHLMTSHDLPPDVITNLVLQSREKTTVGLSHGAEGQQVSELISELRANHRLTPSIIIRSLCMGETAFCEYAFADLTGIPVLNVRVLMYDAGAEGFKGLYEKAKMPAPLLPVFSAALEVIKEMQAEGVDDDQDKFARRIAERVMTQMDSESDIDMSGSDIDFLMAKVSSLPGSYAQPLEN
ncbi:hypothetical protein FACS1894186_3000 [Alphaproteobacteria bacterium]|nr:hypothetical protein FACS1894186_3000 [Alphaproteobacteria bacterium]